MIKSYKYYSQTLQANITISFYEGAFKSVDIELGHEVVKKDGLVKFLANEAEFLKEAKDRNIQLIELDREVTFEMFWDAYKYKTSGKIEAEKAWKKLTKDDQIAAFDYIPVYNSILKTNKANRLHGSTYLNAKRWIK